MESITLDWLIKIVDDLIFQNEDATIRDFIEVKEELEGILNSHKTNNQWQEH